MPTTSPLFSAAKFRKRRRNACLDMSRSAPGHRAGRPPLPLRVALPRVIRTARSPSPTRCYGSAVIRQDYIKRLIEQVGAAIANALGRTGTGQAEEAQERLNHAYSELGIARGFFDLTPESLRKMLGTAERAHAVAELCRLEAKLLERQGDTARAAQRERLARELTR